MLFQYHSSGIIQRLRTLSHMLGSVPRKERTILHGWNIFIGTNRHKFGQKRIICVVEFRITCLVRYIESIYMDITLEEVLQCLWAVKQL